MGKRGPKPKDAAKKRSEKLTTTVEPFISEYVAASTKADESISSRVRELLIKAIEAERSSAESE